MSVSDQPPELTLPKDMSFRELSKFRARLMKWNIFASSRRPQSAISHAEHSPGDQPVFILVAPYLPSLRDVLQLSRLSRSVRKALLTKSNRHGWKAVLRGNPGLPPCPKHLSEPRYVAILFGPECHACGMSGQSFFSDGYKFGWLLCTACLPHNVVSEEELVARLDFLTPPEERDAPSVLKLHLYLPYHTLALPSDGGVPKNYYYKPEAYLVISGYFRAMNSATMAGLMNPVADAAWCLMARVRNEYVKTVNRFAEQLAALCRVDTAASELAVPTLREEIYDSVDFRARGFTEEDLQRGVIHDDFLDQLITDEEVWKTASPRIWEVLKDNKFMRTIQKINDNSDQITFWFEEMIAGMQISDMQRALMPNHANVCLFPCLVDLARRCDDPPTKEQFAETVPQVIACINSYIKRIPLVFVESLEASLAQFACTLRESTVALPVPARSRVLLETAAALFTYAEWLQSPGNTIVLPFPQIHGHFCEAFPNVMWDHKEDAKEGMIHDAGALHAMVPYIPSLLNIRALRLPDDIPLAEMDAMLSHCADEHRLHHEIWGHPNSRRPELQSNPLYRQWADDHAPGKLRYHQTDQRLAYHPPPVETVQEIGALLLANPELEYGGCSICRDLAGPDREDVWLTFPHSAYVWSVADHFRVKHGVTLGFANYMVFLD
ncbi:hypothetical protein BV20DRAFT_1057049 [Pilatotrama ljubarskyi]|nr:hypothetical protein BV20DRAFT_1057049 [Pilatotrama ljubarskyi]